MAPLGGKTLPKPGARSVAGASLRPRGQFAGCHSLLAQRTQTQATTPVPRPSSLACYSINLNAPTAAPRSRPGPALCPGRRAVRVSSAGAAVAELLGRELTVEEADLWLASCEVLSDFLGLSTDEGQRLLARAFGWTSQAFWRREKVDEVPAPERVADALSFLRDDLGLAPEEQLKVVRAFPEVLACEVETRLRTNTAQLQSQWRLQGSTLSKAVLRQPQVLGYSVDCGGDCIGECNRCWARF